MRCELCIDLLKIGARLSRKIGVNVANVGLVAGVAQNDSLCRAVETNRSQRQTLKLIDQFGCGPDTGNSSDFCARIMEAFADNLKIAELLKPIERRHERVIGKVQLCV